MLTSPLRGPFILLDAGLRQHDDGVGNWHVSCVCVLTKYHSGRSDLILASCLTNGATSLIHFPSPPRGDKLHFPLYRQVVYCLLIKGVIDVDLEDYH